MKLNVSCVSRAKMCSGCGACVAMCPTKSISFKESSVGRVYATVDYNCIHCGLCLNVCPSYTCDYEFDDFFSLDKYKIIIGKSLNPLILSNGQSGGAVTAILSYLFEDKKIDAALVCKPIGCGKGVPYIATNSSQLIQCQKSIYTPVALLPPIGSLQTFKSVAIVGLPCHLSAVRKLLKYKRIPITYMLGLICDRTLCKGISDCICEYLQCDNSDGIFIKWRDKNAQGFSYHDAPISVTTDDGKVRIIPTKVRQQLKKYFTPPRCMVCPDKLNLSADLVFGDPWNIHVADNLGESLIIANTVKGYELLNHAINKGVVSSIECTLDQLDKSQHIKKRREQVYLYSRLLLLGRVKNPFLLGVKEDMNPSLLELLRALYSVVRFGGIELLPKAWVTKYFSKKISYLCDDKD